MGFEPTVRLRAQRFSRPSRSTTLAPLRAANTRSKWDEGRGKSALSATSAKKHLPGAQPVDLLGFAAIVRGLRAASGRPRSSLRALMFAVIRTGGKQYRVAKDDVITVEKLDGEAGATVKLGDVLIAARRRRREAWHGLEGRQRHRRVVEQGLGDKVIVFKKRRRHNYRRKNGHRQPLTVLRIDRHQRRVRKEHARWHTRKQAAPRATAAIPRAAASASSSSAARSSLSGNILVRQRGTKYHAGDNVGIGPRPHAVRHRRRRRRRSARRAGGRTYHLGRRRAPAERCRVTPFPSERRFAKGERSAVPLFRLPRGNRR